MAFGWRARCAREIEAYLIHPSNVPVSREHRRAKTDRLDTELLKRALPRLVAARAGSTTLEEVFSYEAMRDWNQNSLRALARNFVTVDAATSAAAGYLDETFIKVHVAGIVHIWPLTAMAALVGRDAQ
jgi:transposase